MMPLTPYNTIEDMLGDIKQNPTANDDLAYKNAHHNHFIYQKYINDAQQTIVVKQFNESSYNGPSTYDFIERLETIYDATKNCLPQTKHAELNLEKQKILNQIINDCHIEPIAIDELLNKEKELLKIINKAWHYLQSFMFKAIFNTHPDAFTHQNTLNNLLIKIANEESILNAQKGRPNFINFYPVNNNDLSLRVSINRVVGHATPSTERQGSKLPNFVECGIGFMENDKYMPQFKGYRHSSYTPIKMIDAQFDDSNYHLLFSNQKKRLAAINTIKFRRRQNAARCAKDMLAELARQELAKGVKQPITLHLSSLAMLSPIKGDKLFMRRGESEHRQLKESYNALMMYNNRDIDITVDGKNVKIKPSITIMNTAANWHGVKTSKYMQSALERNINNQGLNTYITETERFLNSTLFTKNETLNHLFVQQDAAEKKLSENYQMLESFMAQSGNAYSDPIYLSLLQEIETNRVQTYTIEHRILQERMNLLHHKRPEIKQRMEFLSNKRNKSTQEDVEALYYQSLFMYMDKQTEPSQFGARFLLVNEKMGKAVDFYCKSGEDRTGRMQNLLEELCIFSKEKGYFPRYDFTNQCIEKSDNTRQREIAKIVSERSVSRDNTNANAIGARGLQITSAMELNTGLPNFSGSRMGTLARGVYDFFAIKRLWKKYISSHTMMHKNTKTESNTIKNRMQKNKQPDTELLINKPTNR